MDSRVVPSAASSTSPRLQGRSKDFGRRARLPRESSSHLIAAAQPSSLAEKIGFFLFILVNAALFLRPSELFPDLGEAPIYEVIIITCLVFSCGAILKLLQPAKLLDQPITLCVLGLVPAVALSHLSHLNFGEGIRSTIDFSKPVVYYLLLVSLVNTPRRLRWFLFALAAFTAS